MTASDQPTLAAFTAGITRALAYLRVPPAQVDVLVESMSRDITHGCSPCSLSVEPSVFHVEPGLDLVADLLERGLSIRREWADLRIQLFDRMSELSEFYRLDELDTAFEEALIAKSCSPSDTAAALCQAAEKSHEAAIKAADAIQDYEKTFLEAGPRAQRLAAESQFADVYYSATLKNPGATHSPPSATWGTTAPFGGSDPTDVNALKYLHLLLRTVEVDKETHLNCAAADQSGPTLGAADAVRRARDSESHLAALDEEFEKRRRDAIRAHRATLWAALSEPGGPLCLVEQCDGLKRRFERDYGEALALLHHVRIGLKAIYGIDCTSGFPPDEDSQTWSYVEKVLVWVRDQISRQLLFSRRDQSAVLPLSLRRLVGADAFDKALVADGVLRFTIDGKDLKQSLGVEPRYLRLRGLSGYAWSESEASLFRMAVTPPAKSTFVHSTESAGSLQRKLVTPCLVTRAAGRSYHRAPDVCGSSDLYNLSPIGEWKVDIAETSHDGVVPRSAIQDAELDLHVVFQLAG